MKIQQNFEENRETFPQIHEMIRYYFGMDSILGTVNFEFGAVLERVHLVDLDKHCSMNSASIHPRRTTMIKEANDSMNYIIDVCISSNLYLKT